MSARCDVPSDWPAPYQHMYDVVQYLLLRSDAARVLVFAHNSHVLDYRATSHAEAGELSVGQLVRERVPGCYVVAQSGFTGSVLAAPDWGQPAQVMQLERPASSSLSHLLHECAMATGTPSFAIPFERADVRRALALPLASRAIGVVYRPLQENLSHYFECVYPQACDAVIHTDNTTALRL